MRNLTESNLTEAVIGRQAGAQQPRLKEVMSALVRHLHAFIHEVELTEAEWDAAIQFLTAVGRKCDEKRQEFILLSDILGATTMKDFINHRKPPGSTEYTILGPFFRPDAPELEPFANLAEGFPGEPVLLTGRVLTLDGSPVANARIDVWHSDAEGLYDLQMPERTAPALRGVFHTDPHGRFGLRTIKPSSYPIPTDGPVGKLLLALGRHPYRPAHIHFMVRAAGFLPLTTELFVEGDPYLDSDAVFGVRESLIVPFVRHDSAEDASRLELATPFYTVDFDFVLEVG